jgi:anaerobic dimethyl sulfoxide reductase subunit C (anchor subunit)
MSVGAFVILGLVNWYALSKTDEKNANEMSDRALLAIGPVLVLGMLASFLHLGNPINAYRAISNLDSSWLSREILFTLLFVATGAVFALMQWRKVGSFQLRRIIALVAAAFGIVLVYSMANVYMLAAEPSWNSIATPITFYITTFLLGGLALGVAFVLNYYYLKSKDRADIGIQSDLLRTTLKWIAVGSIVLLGVQLIVVPLYVSQLSGGNAAAVESASLLTTEYGWVFLLRLVFVVLGAGLFGIFLYRNALLNKERMMASGVVSAFAFVLVAEVLGRVLFYATHIRIGL